MDYGKRIKQIRTEQGMTQVELAEKTGLLQSQVSMIETGERGLTVDKLKAIVAALDCTISDIIEQ